MTQDEVIEMAREAGAGMLHGGEFALFGNEKLEALIKLAAAKEREACAKVVDDIEARCIAKDVDDPPLDMVAEAIRARGQA
jgi:hypothetical protein